MCMTQNVVDIKNVDALGTDGSPRRGSGSPGASALRSNSAIDLQAAQRAKARAQYAALARHKVGSGASLRKFLVIPPVG
jgi:hypothetical protein